MQPDEDHGLRVLSCQSCRGLLNDLRSVLAEAGLDLEKQPLWHDLADLRWLANLEGPVLANDPDPVGQARRERGFVDAVALKRSVVALELTRKMEGWRTVVKKLRFWRLRGTPEHEITQRTEQSNDFLYEVEMACRLSKLPSSTVAFSEPDLLVHGSGIGTWTAACKRPQKIGSIVRAADVAGRQISKAGRPGVVLISLDNVIDPLVEDTSGKSLEPACHRRMGAIVNRQGPSIIAQLARYLPTAEQQRHGVVGVVTTAWFFLWGRDGVGGPEFMNTRLEPCGIQRAHPAWANEFTRDLIRDLKRADEQVESRY